MLINPDKVKNNLEADARKKARQNSIGHKVGCRQGECVYDCPTSNTIVELRKEVTHLKGRVEHWEAAHHEWFEVAAERKDELIELRKDVAHWKEEYSLTFNESQGLRSSLEAADDTSTHRDALIRLNDKYAELQESYNQLEREALRPAQDYEEQRALALQRGQALRDKDAEIVVLSQGIKSFQRTVERKQRNIEGLGKQAKRERSIAEQALILARDRLDMLHQQEAELTKAVTEATRLRVLLTDSELERSKLAQLYDTQGRSAATYGHQAVTGAERLIVLQAERDGAKVACSVLQKQVDALEERLANMEGDFWDERAKHEEEAEQLKERLAKQVKANEDLVSTIDSWVESNTQLRGKSQDLEARVEHWTGEVQEYKDHIHNGTLVDVSVVDELDREILELELEVREQKAKQAEVVKICDAQWRCDALMGQSVRSPTGVVGSVVGYRIMCDSESVLCPLQSFVCLDTEDDGRRPWYILSAVECL